LLGSSLINRFFGNRKVIQLVLGNIISQGVVFVSTILLVKLYSQEEFGEYSTFIAISSTIGVLLVSKLDEAVIVEDETEIINVLSLIFWQSLFGGLFILILFLVLYFFLSVKYISLSNIFIIPLAIFFSNQLAAWVALWTRKLDVKKASLNRVEQSIYTSAIQFILYKIPGDGLIIGRTFGILIAELRARPKQIIVQICQVKSVVLKSSIKIFSRYYKFSTPFSFVNQLSNNLPLFVLPVLATNAVVANYAMASRLILVPIGLFTAAAQQVFFAQMADMNRKGSNLKLYVVGFYRKAVIYGIFPMISFAIVIPYIFNFFFDTQWNDAGKYAQLLSPWYFIVLLTSSVSGVLVVKQQQKDALVLEILALLFRLLAIYFGTILWNPFTGILLFSMIGFIYNIVLLFKYYTYASSDL
jgi:lipopolysaccharide exporter